MSSPVLFHQLQRQRIMVASAVQIPNPSSGSGSSGGARQPEPSLRGLFPYRLTSRATMRSPGIGWQSSCMADSESGLSPSQRSMSAGVNTTGIRSCNVAINSFGWVVNPLSPNPATPNPPPKKQFPISSVQFQFQ